MLRRTAVIVAMIISVMGVDRHAQAEVSVSVGIQFPAPLMFDAPPPMVWMPELGVYLALNSSYRLFFYAGDYYLFDRGRWFVAPGYGGPWVVIELGRLPRHLKRYRDHDWDGYQRRADGYYRKGYRHDHPYFPSWPERRWERDPHEGRGDPGGAPGRPERRD